MEYDTLRFDWLIVVTYTECVSIIIVILFCNTDIDEKVEKDPDKLPSPVISLTELGPNLDKLWTYSCSMTKGRNVSCMAWNPQNPVSSFNPIQNSS